MFALNLLVASTSCDRAPVATPRKPAVPAGNGIIRGIICFKGAPPKMETIGGNCCPGAEPVVDESISVTAGVLKNAIVYIKDGPNVDLGPMQERVLKQRDCRYIPHVLALRTGQTLVITSHDPTPHNVHIEADANPSQNFSELQGASKTVSFDLPEIIRFKCDVHAWMTAYARVFDHPFFAVSGEDGKFEIGHLPAGKYTLVVWQEKLGEKSMPITVENDKPIEVKLEYSGE